MEQLRTELSHLLGEKLSRVECVSEKPATALWSLYDAQGNPMPLLARSFTTPGVARQLAWKISTLARSGTVRMPVVYGVMTHEEHPNDIPKADQIDMLNRSIDYFKKADTFNENLFKEEVVSDPQIIDAFENFKNYYEEKNELALKDQFDVSNSAVKDEKR